MRGARCEGGERSAAITIRCGYQEREHRSEWRGLVARVLYKVLLSPSPSPEASHEKLSRECACECELFECECLLERTLRLTKQAPPTSASATSVAPARRARLASRVRPSLCVRLEHAHEHAQ